MLVHTNSKMFIKAFQVVDNKAKNTNQSYRGIRYGGNRDFISNIQNPFLTIPLTSLLTFLDLKEIQPVHSEDQPWDFFGRNDAKAETPVLWPPHAKS